MKVTLTCKELDPELAQELGLPSVPDSPLKRAFEALAKSLNHHPALQNLDLSMGIKPSDYPQIDFPDADAEIEVEIILVPNDDAFLLLGATALEDDPLKGVFLMTGEPFERESYLATAFRGLVLCDEKDLNSHMILERDSEMDSSSNQYDDEFVAAYLSTLTHEVAHAVEFITHGHGLTPAQVEIWHDMGVLNHGLNDVVSGRWIRPDMQSSLLIDDSLSNQVMESRVESTGRLWLSDCLSPESPHCITFRKSFDELCQVAGRAMERYFPIPGPTMDNRAASPRAQ